VNLKYRYTLFDTENSLKKWVITPEN